ncbi:hypothetical protein [Rhodococcus sp. NPDC003348]
MFHERIARVVLAVTAGYLVILGFWLGWLLPHTPPATIPFQLCGLLAAYGSALGLGMIWADRPPRADRRIERRGLEGWATIDRSRFLAVTPRHGHLTSLHLQLTVPGEQSYSGSIVYEVPEGMDKRFAPGKVVSIRVDPRDRDRIVLFP